jgi:uncharacterized protein
MKNKLWEYGLLLALLLSGTAQAEVAVPVLKQRVTDLTSTLDTTQIQALDTKLAAFESSKGSQIAVLMISSTQPESIDQFSIRVVESWKLGRKGGDDGVLLLIAKDDRKLRIEVGYGLEGALNDATAKRIVAEIITPYLKRGEFYPGIDAGITALIKLIEGEQLPPPLNRSAGQSEKASSHFEQLLGAGFVIFMFGNIILRQLLGRLPSGLVIGTVIGILAWVMLLSLAWAIAASIIAFLLSLLFGMNSGGSALPIGLGGGRGGWGSSGGAGGSFGGGGGGFGGGGASGGW